MKHSGYLFALLLPLAAIVGCADGGGATAAAGAAVNTVCPCMGGKIDGKTSVEWNGQTVGFCCPPCIDTWNEMSDEERTKALAEAEEGDHDHDHGSHDDHGEHGQGDHDHGDADNTDSDEAGASATTEESSEESSAAAESESNSGEAE